MRSSSTTLRDRRRRPRRGPACRDRRRASGRRHRPRDAPYACRSGLAPDLGGARVPALVELDRVADAVRLALLDAGDVPVRRVALEEHDLEAVSGADVSPGGNHRVNASSRARAGSRTRPARGRRRRSAARATRRPRARLLRRLPHRDRERVAAQRTQQRGRRQLLEDLDETSSAAVAMPGPSSGRWTSASRRERPAPRLRAASSSERRCASGGPTDSSASAWKRTTYAYTSPAAVPVSSSPGSRRSTQASGT